MLYCECDLADSSQIHKNNLIFLFQVRQIKFSNRTRFCLDKEPTLHFNVSDFSSSFWLMFTKAVERKWENINFLIATNEDNAASKAF